MGEKTLLRRLIYAYAKIEKMKIAILYYPESEHARKVEEYVHDFSREHNAEIELISLASRDGADTAKLYDIVQYPAILAMDDAGVLQKAWQGPILPLMSDVAYYVESVD